jgi:hypothetical protein
MAKYDIDPVLQQLAQAINESGQAAAPITVSVHGAVLTGALDAGYNGAERPGIVDGGEHR